MLSHIVTYLAPRVALAYSEPCYIQNLGIFRIQNVFRTLSRRFVTYLERCATLAYWERCHIQNFGIFRTRGIFRILFIKAHSSLFGHYSIMIVIIIILTFFHTNLTFFSTKFKKTFVFWLQWNSETQGAPTSQIVISWIRSLVQLMSQPVQFSLILSSVLRSCLSVAYGYVKSKLKYIVCSI